MQILISQMDRLSADGFVTVVHWVTQKTQGEFTASQYGTESFTEEGTFKPFAELTEAEVVSWLTTRWGADGVAAKEAALDTQLANLANPPIVSGLPW
jgi:hypothetical protein